ncbi:MAG: hypothetical protein ABH956_01355 [Candidatus Nealsonbacteria bacterium]
MIVILPREAEEKHFVQAERIVKSMKLDCRRKSKPCVTSRVIDSITGEIEKERIAIGIMQNGKPKVKRNVFKGFDFGFNEDRIFFYINSDGNVAVN